MASSFITLKITDTNARFVGDLKQASNLTRQLMDLLDSITDRGFRYLGSPADYAAFEVAYGLPTGTGQAVFDICNGTRLALTGAAQNNQAIELRDRIG